MSNKPIDNFFEDEPEPEKPELRLDADAVYAELMAKSRRTEPLDDNLTRSSRETQWKLEEPLPEIIDPELVVTGKKPCNICNDDGQVYRHLIGQDTGAGKWDFISCPCSKYKAYRLLMNRLPVHDQHIRFNQLAPNEVSFMPMDMQPGVIARIKASPDKNWMMYGPAGWSKSTFSIALYERAVRNQLEDCFKKYGSGLLDALDRGYFPVWRVYASRLVDALQKHAYDDGPEPPVTVSKVNHAWLVNGWRPRLFIEEIDKLGNLTKDRLKHLWDVVAAVFDNKGQLVITSNMTPEAFESEFGGDILRRATNDGLGGVLLDLFEYAGESEAPKN